MTKRVIVLAAALLTPGLALAQGAGEVIGASAIQVPSDLFACGRGITPCDLRVRTYNEIDPTDFYGFANPVDGYPRYFRARGYYQNDPQITGNYPSAYGVLDLNWYAVWDGVTNSDRFDHVGYYGAQSQVISFGELGNNTSPTCLPVVAQTACFLALWSNAGNDLDGLGPAGSVSRSGGLSPMPRPVASRTSVDEIEFVWEEAAAATITDGAPHPIQGYKLFFMVRDASDRLGPTQAELATAESQGQLIDATPGTFIPRTTTAFTLSVTDPLLAGFDPLSQKLVAVTKLLYAHDVTSTYFSANSFPAAFADPLDQVRDFSGRLVRNRVILTWSADGLAGIRGFNVVRSGRLQGPYHPISPRDTPVDGVRGTFFAVDTLSRRIPERASVTSMFYRLEVTTADGSRRVMDPIEVDLQGLRRGANGR